MKKAYQQPVLELHELLINAAFALSGEQTAPDGWLDDEE